MVREHLRAWRGEVPDHRGPQALAVDPPRLRGIAGPHPAHDAAARIYRDQVPSGRSPRSRPKGRPFFRMRTCRGMMFVMPCNVKVGGVVAGRTATRSEKLAMM